MSFQFNFFKSETPETENTKINTLDSMSTLDSVNPLDSVNTDGICKEWIVPSIEGTFDSEPVDDHFPGLLKRKYSSIVSDLKGKEQDGLAVITEESDVVPRQYEGGLKTWECSIDLLHYLKEESQSIKRSVSSVLEVGCGSGLPGIYARKLVQAPKLFVFQDFNQSVLESVTLPNVLLNFECFERDQFKFFYGDWCGLPQLLPQHAFDLILTSETIYRTESYPALLEIFRHALKPATGRVLLAAKDYYFGLGGSVQQFWKRASSLGWQVKLVRQFSEGVPRSILELTLP